MERPQERAALDLGEWKFQQCTVEQGRTRLRSEDILKVSRSHIPRWLPRRGVLTSTSLTFPDSQVQDFDRMSKCLKVLLGVTLENKEHALRGWNWGKADFGRQELAFNVQNRPAFEIPYSEIQNTNLAGKNEVAVTLSLDGEGKGVGTDGKMGGAKAKGQKGGGALDQLTELRFYIPGTTTTTKREKEGGEDGELESEDEVTEEQNAANLFHDTLTKMADIGDVAGDTYASFLDILHLTPRFVSYVSHKPLADKTAEVGSIWTCTSPRSE